MASFSMLRYATSTKPSLLKSNNKRQIQKDNPQNRRDAGQCKIQRYKKASINSKQMNVTQVKNKEIQTR
jgi:hypothetical protein